MTPYEAGAAAGRATSRGFRQASDKSALDEILQNAITSQDPSESHDMIRQIISRVSPERQGVALQALQSQMRQLQGKQQKLADESYFTSQGMPGLGSASPTVQKAVLARQAKPNPFENKASQLAATELSQADKKLGDYQDISNDIKRMYELQEASTLYGIEFSQKQKNEYKALLSKNTQRLAALQKGVQSDQDLAMLIESLGTYGTPGGSKILKTALEGSQGIYQRESERYGGLASKYGQTPLKNAYKSQAAIAKSEGNDQVKQLPNRKVQVTGKDGHKYAFPPEIAEQGIAQLKAEGLL